jgi:hypothetical protein
MDRLDQFSRGVAFLDPESAATFDLQREDERYPRRPKGFQSSLCERVHPVLFCSLNSSDLPFLRKVAWLKALRNALYRYLVGQIW